MKAVIQRVSQASVSINHKPISQIGSGFLILLGVSQADKNSDVNYLVEKISKLRIMADKGKKMNLSITDAQGEVLVVSQFTLLADTSKGNRPSFIKAAKPKKAQKLYRLFIDKLQQKNIKVAAGKFGAMMEINLINDGPVTIVLDSHKNTKTPQA